MYEQSIMEEADKYKDSSRFKIKTMILVYKCLKFWNGDVFYFLYTLAMILTPLFIFNFSVGIIFLGMLVHYVLFMTYLKTKINQIFKSKQEIREIEDVIEVLESHLKNKNPN